MEVGEQPSESSGASFVFSWSLGHSGRHGRCVMTDRSPVGAFLLPSIDHYHAF